MSATRKHSWSRTKAGRAHARKTITAFNASAEGEAHALAVVKCWQNDPLVKLKQRLHLSLLHASQAAKRGDITGARGHLGKVELVAAELARIGGLQ